MLHFICNKAANISGKMILSKARAASVINGVHRNMIKSFSTKAQKNSGAACTLSSASNVMKQQKARTKPMTPNQERYSEYLADSSVPVVIGIGKAGSGKTLLAASQAITSFYNKDVSKILITRPAVTLDEDHGFLPGNLQDKMAPYLKPLFDCFLQYYSVETLRSMMKEEVIEICPMAYIRGRTFHDAFIIADEMQNTTPNQMKTFLTRIGQNTRTAITGDLEQCDLRELNGLRQFLDQLTLYNRLQYAKGMTTGTDSVKVVEFTEDDVQRSQIVKTVLSIYGVNPGEVHDS